MNTILNLEIEPSILDRRQTGELVMPAWRESL